MLTLKKTLSLILFIMISGSGVFAQQLPPQPEQEGSNEEVTDEELKQFASAFKHVQTIDQQAQQKMIGSVEEAGLEVERYNELHQARQNPNQEIDASNEELENFNAATEEIMEIQTEAQEEIQLKIREEGLTITRYQEVMQILQNDTDLQQKLQQYLQNEG